MIKSMTGFGRNEQIIENMSINVQIRSVNHRYGDFTVRVPRYYPFLEDKIREYAGKHISRGKVEIYVSIEQKQDDSKVISLNTGVLSGYLDALNRMAAEFGLLNDATVSTVARNPDVFNVEYKEADEEQILSCVMEVLKPALDDFVSMRRDEGERMKLDMERCLHNIMGQLELVEIRSPQSVEEYRAKVTVRMKELLEESAVEETRILAEAALFADKVSVNEEIVRLRSHIKEFEKALDGNSPIGKKMDFIVQEMNREANTIGSKANDFELSKCVVEIKSEIEKLREQVQNIE